MGLGFENPSMVKKEDAPVSTKETVITSKGPSLSK